MKSCSSPKGMNEKLVKSKGMTPHRRSRQETNQRLGRVWVRVQVRVQERERSGRGARALKVSRNSFQSGSSLFRTAMSTMLRTAVLTYWPLTRYALCLCLSVRTGLERPDPAEQAAMETE